MPSKYEPLVKLINFKLKSKCIQHSSVHFSEIIQYDEQINSSVIYFYLFFHVNLVFSIKMEMLNEYRGDNALDSDTFRITNRSKNIGNYQK